MPRQVRSFTIDGEMSKWIDKEADRLGIPKSELVNILLADAREDRVKTEQIEALGYAGLGTAALTAILVVASFIPV